MTKASSKKKPANGARAPRRSYERTTPVGRVKKHLEKALRIAVFAADRIATWDHAPDLDLGAALAHARNGVDHLTKSLTCVKKLFDENWVPPKRSAAATFTEGEEVKVGDKYRPKYLLVYEPKVIDNLVVSQCLPSGEIVVRHGSTSPFMVAKSHIEKKRQRAHADGTDQPGAR